MLARLCTSKPYKDAPNTLHGRDRTCPAYIWLTAAGKPPMVLLLLHLHLLAQLYTALLFSLALARLEYGLCHSKVAHLPLLHQLLYHCLQVKCVLAKKEHHALCCAPSAHHTDCRMPQIKVSVNGKSRNCFASDVVYLASGTDHCLTLCCNAQQQIAACFLGRFTSVGGPWHASMEDWKKLAYAVLDCHNHTKPVRYPGKQFLKHFQH